MGCSVVKNPPAMVETWTHRFSPWLGTSPGEGNGNSLQYSFQENPMDRGAWWATVHGAEISWVLLATTTTKPITTVNWTLTGLRCYTHIVPLNSYLKPLG